MSYLINKWKGLKGYKVIEINNFVILNYITDGWYGFMHFCEKYRGNNYHMIHTSDGDINKIAQVRCFRCHECIPKNIITIYKLLILKNKIK